MRTQAIENLLKLMVNASMLNDEETMTQYRAKARILLDREEVNASVIRELVNQTVELKEEK